MEACQDAPEAALSEIVQRINPQQAWLAGLIILILSPPHKRGDDKGQAVIVTSQQDKGYHEILLAKIPRSRLWSATQVKTRTTFPTKQGPES